MQEVQYKRIQCTINGKPVQKMVDVRASLTDLLRNDFNLHSVKKGCEVSYRRWEFDMENDRMKGHWIGVFADKGNKTEIDFTERVEAKKWLLKPFVKAYLRKQQTQFVADIREALKGM